MSCLCYCTQHRLPLENNLKVLKSGGEKKEKKPNPKNHKEKPQQLGSFAVVEKDEFALNYSKIKSADNRKNLTYGTFS